jgi:beta-lactamase superfamily II metal-dependent hydrolase
MAATIKANDLLIHILNVGFGDNIIIQFPADENGNRSYGIVDCCNGSKTKRYLDALMPGNKKRLEFICATHPHGDHISGIRSLMTNTTYRPQEFWDSGFRHNSNTYKKILEEVVKKKIKMLRVSSGMEWYFGRVKITALSPAVHLRNRYATYGVDMNNASIVLRIEHNLKDSVTVQSNEYSGNEGQEVLRSAGKSVAILAGDAEYDSWSYITQEYPVLNRTSKHKPLVDKMINQLGCSVVKVAHHGSMHSTPLDVYEMLSPKTAIISCKQKISSKTVSGGRITRNLFPHRITELALIENKSNIITTDGSYERDNSRPNPHEGSVIIVVPPGKKPKIVKLNDDSSSIPTLPNIP